MYCVEKKNSICSFKDKAIFHVILEIDSFEQKNREKCPLSSQPPLKKKKIKTVHNLITFSIVFTFFFLLVQKIL